MTVREIASKSCGLGQRHAATGGEIYSPTFLSLSDFLVVHLTGQIQLKAHGLLVSPSDGDCRGQLPGTQSVIEKM